MAAIQDGGCEHGNVGWAVQQLYTCSILSQLEVLSIWVHGGLLHGTLPVPQTDDLSLGQVG